VAPRHCAPAERLPGSTPVEGGALVLNHQHRAVPQERSPRPYSRPEFLAVQTEPVITTLALFEVWREEDAGGVRRLLFGDVDPLAVESTLPTEESESVGRRRGWFRRC
jgi:hypothetical protein